MTAERTDLLIVGAGPFGLSAASRAWHLGIDHVVVGEPMRFWQANMPKGMYLRSACDWHLDPQNVDTIDAFLRESHQTAADVEPLSLEFYLRYTRWFQDRQQIAPWPMKVDRLDVLDGGNRRFRATLADGTTIEASRVVVAVGFEHFTHEPDDVRAVLPRGRIEHTCHCVDFDDMRNRRCLIVGGRQSAFEWAALMREAGAAAVHVSHRHASPAFAPADWSWVNPIVDGMIDNPGWFRSLTQVEKDDVGRRLWAEGRLKVEPWLASRVLQDPITLWPDTRLGACRELPDGTLEITLDGHDRSDVVRVDRIVLATGYKAGIGRVPFLARGNVLARLNTDAGCPVLDEHLQTSVPGLFVTSMAATRDFGPFFAFTVSVRTSAHLIGQALQS
jgi:lysine/ornithine N-monooxygenase